MDSTGFDMFLDYTGVIKHTALFSVGLKALSNNLIIKFMNNSKVDIPTQPTLNKGGLVGSLVSPNDRFKGVALFLLGYLSYPENKIDEVANIIRRYSAINEPYQLCTCQKCKNEVELRFYEGDEDECSEPHYTCPNSQCRAIYYDKLGKERWEELESHYEDIEERYRERQYDFDDDEW